MDFIKQIEFFFDKLRGTETDKDRNHELILTDAQIENPQDLSYYDKDGKKIDFDKEDLDKED